MKSHLIAGIGMIFSTLAFASQGCDDGDCTPGRQTSCACPAGSVGTQLCGDDGTFGTCECTPGTGGGAATSSSVTTASGMTTTSSTGVGGNSGCPTGEKICNGSCVNTDTSDAHCGECNNACPAAATCSTGLCDCPGSQIICESACLDASSDPLNCGSCGRVCAVPQGGVGGAGGAGGAGGGGPLLLCQNGLCPLETIADGQNQVHGLALTSTHVYWTSEDGANDKVWRADLDGGNPEELANNQDNPREIGVVGDVAYWANYGVPTQANAPGQIQRYDPNDGGLATLVDNQTDGLFGLAATPGFVYWTNILSGIAARAATTNPGPGPFGVASALGEPQDIAVDDTHLYVSEYASGQVRRQPIGGGNTQLIAQAQGGPTGVALSDTHCYFANASAGQVRRVPLGGGTVEDVATGQQTPSYVAVDDQWVYWTNYGNGTVSRAPLSGGAVQLLAAGQNQPYQIAVDDAHVYWSTLGAGTVMRTVK